MQQVSRNKPTYKQLSFLSSFIAFVKLSVLQLYVRERYFPFRTGVIYNSELKSEFFT